MRSSSGGKPAAYAVRDAAGVVVAHPAGAIPVASHRHVVAATELALNGAGIQRLQGFAPFLQLHTLWLNDNELSSLSGLESCFRLKRLYAARNRLTSVQAIEGAHFLEELDLSGNALARLDRCLEEELSCFRHLTHLWLDGCPASREVNYRGKVICAILSLHALDNQVVTPAERRVSV